MLIAIDGGTPDRVMFGGGYQRAIRVRRGRESLAARTGTNAGVPKQKGIMKTPRRPNGGNRVSGRGSLATGPGAASRRLAAETGRHHEEEARTAYADLDRPPKRCGVDPRSDRCGPGRRRPWPSHHGVCDAPGHYRAG